MMARHVVEIPSDLPIVERDVVRVVVRDGEDRILLFHTREISAPELGTWWELPGGGLDPGETHVDAAVRELREETGITVAPEQVGPPSWRRIGVFRHRDVRQLQHEVVVRWWPVRDVLESQEMFYPRSLPQLLARFLRGEELDEPTELWS